MGGGSGGGQAVPCTQSRHGRRSSRIGIKILRDDEEAVRIAISGIGSYVDIQYIPWTAMDLLRLEGIET